MELLRSEVSSIFYYIKNCVLGANWAEQNLEQSVTEIESGIYQIGYDDDWIDVFSLGEYPGQGEGRGLLYFNIPTTPSNYSCNYATEQTTAIALYNNLGITVSGYTIDYLKGRILYTGTENLDTIDYYWHYVSVIDAWPHKELPQLPIVSVLHERFDRKGFQLGGGHKRFMDWNIEIFANNKGERDDLLEIIFDSLNNRHCSLYSFTNGYPLMYDGTFNPDFTLTRVPNYSIVDFLNVEASITGLPNWGFLQTEDLNKYRAAINFSTEVYYL